MAVMEKVSIYSFRENMANVFKGTTFCYQCFFNTDCEECKRIQDLNENTYQIGINAGCEIRKICGEFNGKKEKVDRKGDRRTVRGRPRRIPKKIDDEGK